MHFRGRCDGSPEATIILFGDSRGEGRLGHSTRDGAYDHREYNSRTRLFRVVRLLEPEAKVPTVEGCRSPDVDPDDLPIASRTVRVGPR